MEGIEGVEEILRPGPADEAAPTIVEGDGDEGETWHPPHGQHTTADDGLQQEMTTQYVEQQDKRKTCHTIVGTKHKGKDTQPQQCRSLTPAAAPETLYGPHPQKTQQQREHDVMPCWMQQPPGHL